MAAQRSAKPSVTYINRGVLQKKDLVAERKKFPGKFAADLWMLSAATTVPSHFDCWNLRQKNIVKAGKQQELTGHLLLITTKLVDHTNSENLNFKTNVDHLHVTH